MKILEIVWQRLVDEDGNTCDRCGATEEAVDSAAGKLALSLQPLGIGIDLHKKSLSFSRFRDDPIQSNLILIQGRPMEEWLEAQTGQSVCCGPCGDSQCRTVTVGGTTYEAIPSELIIKAGMIAGASLLQGEAGDGCDSQPGCCSC